MKSMMPLPPPTRASSDRLSSIRAVDSALKFSVALSMICSTRAPEGVDLKEKEIHCEVTKNGEIAECRDIAHHRRALGTDHRVQPAHPVGVLGHIEVPLQV